jgi:hypothetical protein
MTAAAMVGGVETARTGDIGKGISAGLGAYGGASLTAGMTTAGSTAMAGDAAALAGSEAAAYGASQGFSPQAIDVLKRQAIDEGALQQGMSEITGKTTTGELLSKGFNVAKNDPMAYLKTNAKPLMYALGPAILAGESAEQNMPKTTTGMIRPYSFDPYSGTYTSGNPYQATPTRGADGGLMGLAAGGMAGYEDDEEGMATGGMGGMFNFAQQSEPVVRVAEGGVPGYANGGPLDVNNPIYQYFADPATQALLAAGNDKAVAQALQDRNYSLADVAKATGTQDKLADYSGRFVNAVAQPGTSASEFLAATQDVGLQGRALEDAFKNSGLSASAQYALTHELTDTTAPQTDFYNQFGYTLGALPGDQGGLEGLYANINYSAQGLQNQINAGKLTVDQAQRLSDAEMRRLGVSMGDVKAATGKDLFSLFKPKEDKKVVTPFTTTNVTTPTNLTTAPITSLSPGVSGAGTTTVNPNGTITTRPDLTLGMGQVRDDYVRGGGSLGYTPYTPQTIEEFDTKYGSRLTGGSKQSLDYLTGKTKYSPVPYTETGEIMKPYASSVLGIPMASSNKMYLFDPATKTYKINPDYAIPTYDKEGKKSLNLTNQDVINYVKSPEYSNDDAFVSWMTANNLTPEQVAAATGMPISEVYKKIKKAKPVDAVVDTPVTGQNDGGGGGEANGGLMSMARGGMAQQFNLGDYSDGGRLLRGPGDGVSDSIPATIGNKRPARLADGEFVVPARIVSELGNGSTEAGARKLYAMMDRIQSARRGTVGRGRVAKNSRADKHLPA